MPESLSWTSIHVDYDEDEAITKAIHDCNFEGEVLGLQPTEIPVMGKGKVDHEVAELEVNEYLYTDELRALIESLGCKAADPLTTLRYAVTRPNNDRDLVGAVDDMGMEWCLQVSKSNVMRTLNLSWAGDNELWPKDVSLLVVRK